MALSAEAFDRIASKAEERAELAEFLGMHGTADAARNVADATRKAADQYRRNGW